MDCQGEAEVGRIPCPAEAGAQAGTPDDTQSHPQAQAFLAGILSALHETVVAVFDREGRHTFLHCSPEMESRYGVQTAELIGRSLEEVIGPERGGTMMQTLRGAFATGRPAREEYEVHLPSGVFWQEVSYCPMRGADGQPVAVVALIRDVTAHKQVLTALQESEARFRNLMDHVPGVAIQGYTTDGTVSYWNKASEAVYGYSAGEALGRHLGDLVIPPEIRPLFDSCLQVGKQAARSGELIPPTECMLLHKDGHRIPVFSIHTVVCIENRQPMLFCIDVDLSERKRAEEALRASEARMRQAQKLESLGILAGGIAHDFNNLLMIIQGNADIALWDLPEDSPARQCVEEIRRASLRAAELTGQMLAYSGKGRFAFQTVDLPELVRDMTSLLKASISRKAELACDLVPSLPAVRADPDQVRQLVMNLVTNASDALGERAGRITLRTGLLEADRAFLAGTRIGEGLPEGPYVFLEVADTGCGMDEATLAKLFDPFFTTKFTGHGLGLAAVLGILRAHRGTVHVRSMVGEGSVFQVLFPPSASSARSDDMGAGADEMEGWRGSGTILVVDDEDGIRDLAARTLSERGFRVLTACEGAEAVEVFNRHRDEITLVLLDLTMPRMGGEEVLRELRRVRQDVPVLLCSGYGRRDAAERFAGMDLAGFLHKPYSLREMVALVRRVLGGGPE